MRSLYLRFIRRYRPEIVLLVPHIKRLVVEVYQIVLRVKVQQLVAVAVVPHVVLSQLHLRNLLAVVNERQSVRIWRLVVLH